MNPVRDEAGVIQNTAALGYEDVVGKKVRCPACGSFVFEMWPEGWDAHAECNCSAMLDSPTNQRKEIFKQTFSTQFKQSKATNQKFNPDMERVFASFSRIYLGGIPALMTGDSAFLSFICSLTATEALAGV